MRAIQYHASGQTPQLVELPEPVPSDDGVVIKVHATGVCRSDWHAWQGHDPVPLPLVPGHEFAGIIHAIGKDVTGLIVGQRVTVPFVLACGACDYCRAGEGQVCPNQTQPGFARDGSFAEYVAVSPALNVVSLPAQIDDVTAAALGCRFATAYRAITTHGRLQQGQWIGVYGCGGVGLSAVLIAHSLGGHVVAVDRSPQALELAHEFGADVTLSAAPPQHLAEQVRARTDGGTHVGIDALGSPDTAVSSVLGLRRRGRHVQVGLLLGDHAHPPLPMDRVVFQELEIYGSHGMAAPDYPAMIQLAAGLDLTRLVKRVIGLAQAPQALVELSEGAGVGITVVDPRR